MSHLDTILRQAFEVNHTGRPFIILGRNPQEPRYGVHALEFNRGSIPEKAWRRNGYTTKIFCNFRESTDDAIDPQQARLDLERWKPMDYVPTSTAWEIVDLLNKLKVGKEWQNAMKPELSTADAKHPLNVFLA